MSNDNYRQLNTQIFSNFVFDLYNDVISDITNGYFDVATENGLTNVNNFLLHIQNNPANYSNDAHYYLLDTSDFTLASNGYLVKLFLFTKDRIPYLQVTKFDPKNPYKTAVDGNKIIIQAFLEMGIFPSFRHINANEDSIETKDDSNNLNTTDNTEATTTSFIENYSILTSNSNKFDNKLDSVLPTQAVSYPQELLDLGFDSYYYAQMLDLDALGMPEHLIQYLAPNFPVIEDTDPLANLRFMMANFEGETYISNFKLKADSNDSGISTKLCRYNFHLLEDQDFSTNTLVNTNGLSIFTPLDCWDKEELRYVYPRNHLIPEAKSPLISSSPNFPQNPYSASEYEQLLKADSSSRDSITKNSYLAKLHTHEIRYKSIFHRPRHFTLNTLKVAMGKNSLLVNYLNLVQGFNLKNVFVYEQSHLILLSYLGLFTPSKLYPYGLMQQIEESFTVTFASQLRETILDIIDLFYALHLIITYEEESFTPQMAQEYVNNCRAAIKLLTRFVNEDIGALKSLPQFQSYSFENLLLAIEHLELPPQNATPEVMVKFARKLNPNLINAIIFHLKLTYVYNFGTDDRHQDQIKYTIYDEDE